VHGRFGESDLLLLDFGASLHAPVPRSSDGIDSVYRARHQMQNLKGIARIISLDRPMVQLRRAFSSRGSAPVANLGQRGRGTHAPRRLRPALR